MQRKYSRPWRILLVTVPSLLVFLSLPAEGVTISGIMVYSTDDFGNPSGVNSEMQDRFEAHMWRTLVRPTEHWHGLAVTQGLPPRSIDSNFLNFPNFAVDLPLDEGENYFTLFGEPGPLTATDDYHRFAVNLYFDGDETNPGISVLFPRFADLAGASVSPSRANEDDVYSLAVQKVPTRPKSYYDDGVFRVSVLEASFLPPERANLSVDRVDQRAMASGGSSDWVGTLTVLVEPSENFGPGGGPPVPVGRGGSGGGGGTGVGAPGTSGGPVFAPQLPVGVPGAIDPDSVDGGFDHDSTAGKQGGEFWHQGDKVEDSDEDAEDEGPEGTRTPEDLVDALQRWLAAANEGTPAPDEEETGETPGATPETTKTPDSTTPTAAAQATATPDATALGTSTPEQTATAAGQPTPTPAVSGTAAEADK